MAGQQLFLVCDSSTYANYSSWASPISAWFASCGWLQGTDTGQVMWSGMNLTAVSMSGSNATYTYNTLAGLALATGRTLTITGMTNSVNNGTFRITALGSGTFTVVNVSGTNESGSSGVVTKASSAPGSAAFYYEIWQPGDSLQNFYVKIEYGNISGTNCPSLRLTLSTATNGSGTLTGYVTQAYSTNVSSYTAPSTTTTYECNFSGTSGGRMSVMMWRNAPSGNPAQMLFSIERSLNASGVYTSSYVTLAVMGYTSVGFGYALPAAQQSLVFGVGPGPGPTNSLRNASPTSASGWCTRQPLWSLSTTSFNNSIPVDLVSPVVGYFDYPMTTLGAALGADMVEGITFTMLVYGNTCTYMPSKNGTFADSQQNTIGAITAAVLMRVD